MIEQFVKTYYARQDELRDKLAAKHPDEYIDLVRTVVDILTNEDDYDAIDPQRIHQIDDGAYQGTLVFVIAAKGYQPSKYWSVMISYGSCSGCDTLQAIRDYSDDIPTEEQVKQYMTLALHVVQKLKPLGDYEDCV